MIGQKRPLKPKDVWTIRVRLQLEGRKRDLPMFNLAIDSKLRGCDLVRLRVDDVLAGGRVRDRATVIQKKTGRPVQFEITEQARSAIGDWLAAFDTHRGRYLFPSRFQQQPHLSTRQHARIVHRWVERAGLDSSAYGTHSLRRTKAARIYRKTGNLRAVQLLLGHTKLPPRRNARHSATPAQRAREGRGVAERRKGGGGGWLVAFSSVCNRSCAWARGLKRSSSGQSL
jgi:integrase